jgi:hypothetical protein
MTYFSRILTFRAIRKRDFTSRRLRNCRLISAVLDGGMILRTALSFLFAILLGGQVLAATPEEQVTQAVDTFFTAYLKDVNGFIERTDRSKGKPAGPEAWKPYLTKKCYAAYLKVLKIPDLDYDPLLQSNNVPDAFEVKKVRVEGDTAWASAKYVGYVETTPLLELRLKEEKGKWLIDAIRDLNK